MADFDNIRSKTNSKEYEENYDRIFRGIGGGSSNDKCCGKCSPCSNHDKESSVLEDVKETK